MNVKICFGCETLGDDRGSRLDSPSKDDLDRRSSSLFGNTLDLGNCKHVRRIGTSVANLSEWAVSDDTNAVLLAVVKETSLLLNGMGPSADMKWGGTW